MIHLILEMRKLILSKRVSQTMQKLIILLWKLNKDPSMKKEWEDNSNYNSKNKTKMFSSNNSSMKNWKTWESNYKENMKRN